MAIAWTWQDTEATYQHGWSLFQVDNGDFELMALDDPFGVNSDDYAGPVFNTDSEAAEYAKKQAAAGDALARKAIDFLKEHNSPSLEAFNLK